MPIDRGVLDQQLQALGESQRWWEVREFRDLPTVLHADERLLALSRGRVARIRWVRPRWLIVVTERRLVCIRSGGRTGWRQIEVKTDQISRTGLRIGPFHARLIVVAGGRRYRFLVSRADGYRLSSTLSSLAPRLPETRSGLRPVLLARRVIDHVLALPAAAFSPDADADHPAVSPEAAVLQEKIDSMERELEELRRQVQFLEQLLQQQHASAGHQMEVPGRQPE
ncbi:MAG: PH domain-containing protein [Gemmatimonadetes bacterium]|nr:PH domain-containing protein [Gemmatimonadota bacterium]